MVYPVYPCAMTYTYSPKRLSLLHELKEGRENARDGDGKCATLINDELCIETPLRSILLLCGSAAPIMTILGLREFTTCRLRYCGRSSKILHGNWKSITNLPPIFMNLWIICHIKYLLSHNTQNEVWIKNAREIEFNLEDSIIQLHDVLLEWKKS